MYLKSLNFPIYSYLTPLTSVNLLEIMASTSAGTADKDKQLITF